MACCQGSGRWGDFWGCTRCFRLAQYPVAAYAESLHPSAIYSSPLKGTPVPSLPRHSRLETKSPKLTFLFAECAMTSGRIVFRFNANWHYSFSASIFFPLWPMWVMGVRKSRRSKNLKFVFSSSSYYDSPKWLTHLNSPIVFDKSIYSFLPVCSLVWPMLFGLFSY